MRHTELQICRNIKMRHWDLHTEALRCSGATQWPQDVTATLRFFIVVFIQDEVFFFSLIIFTSNYLYFTERQRHRQRHRDRLRLRQRQRDRDREIYRKRQTGRQS